MPANRFRSRSYKRVHKNTPGGENVLRYKKKKPSKHVCAECGAVLHGVPRGRPYGGYLCSSCARKHFKNEARK